MRLASLAHSQAGSARLADEIVLSAGLGVGIKRGEGVHGCKTRDGVRPPLINNNMTHHSIISTFSTPGKRLSFLYEAPLNVSWVLLRILQEVIRI